MFRIEWREGGEWFHDKLTEFCPIYLLVTSAQSEFFSRLMLEITNNSMRNEHVLKAMTGKN